MRVVFPSYENKKKKYTYNQPKSTLLQISGEVVSFISSFNLLSAGGGDTFTREGDCVADDFDCCCCNGGCKSLTGGISI